MASQLDISGISPEMQRTLQRYRSKAGPSGRRWGSLGQALGSIGGMIYDGAAASKFERQAVDAANKTRDFNEASIGAGPEQESKPTDWRTKIAQQATAKPQGAVSTESPEWQPFQDKAPQKPFSNPMSVKATSPGPAAVGIGEMRRSDVKPANAIQNKPFAPVSKVERGTVSTPPAPTLTQPHPSGIPANDRRELSNMLPGLPPLPQPGKIAPIKPAPQSTASSSASPNFGKAAKPVAYAKPIDQAKQPALFGSTPAGQYAPPSQPSVGSSPASSFTPPSATATPSAPAPPSPTQQRSTTTTPSGVSPRTRLTSSQMHTVKTLLRGTYENRQRGMALLDKFRQQNSPAASLGRQFKMRQLDLLNARIAKLNRPERDKYALREAAGKRLGLKGQELQVFSATGKMAGAGENRPGGGLYKDQKEYLKSEQALRKEFSGLTSDHRKIYDAYGKIAATDDSGAGDLSMIFSFMKILDPGSVVREGEFANAENAGGVTERIRNLHNKILNGERLSPTMRQQFKSQAQSLYDRSDKTFQLQLKRFEKIAKAHGLDMSRVAPNYSEGAPQVAGSATAPASVRTATNPKTGETTTWNGKSWVPVQ